MTVGVGCNICRDEAATKCLRFNICVVVRDQSFQVLSVFMPSQKQPFLIQGLEMHHQNFKKNGLESFGMSC